MRTYTIALSIVAHVIAACAMIIVPLVATDELPAPRTATEFIHVIAPLEPPTPPPPRASTRPAVESPRTDVAPLAVPDGIQPESLIEPSHDATPVESGVVGFGNSDSVIADPVPPPPPPPSPVPVGGHIRPPQKITDVPPVYPAIARAARVEGIVILEVVIGADGSVRDPRVLRSIPLLDAAAVEAVRQWRFTPTLLNGEPVPVVMTITVSFRLN
jgi:protein TonB